MRTVANGCEKFLRAYYNDSYWNMDRNGEGRVLEIFCLTAKKNPVVFDVGANHGDWTARLLALRPDSEVYCFELIPSPCNQHP
jgi:hypothetical protein